MLFISPDLPFPSFAINLEGMVGSFLQSWNIEEDSLLPGSLYRHIGLYVYRRSLLLSISQMEPTPLEAAEGLEQLRLLENGWRIKVVPADYHPVGVDTPEDLKEARKILTGEDFP